MGREEGREKKEESKLSRRERNSEGGGECTKLKMVHIISRHRKQTDRQTDRQLASWTNDRQALTKQ